MGVCGLSKCKYENSIKKNVAYIAKLIALKR
jgi:hypothetical protein